MMGIGIRADRAADRTPCRRAPGGQSDRPIGARLTEAQRPQFGPHRALEGGAREPDREIEVEPCTGEILGELLKGILENGVGAGLNRFVGKVAAALDRERRDGLAV